MRHNMTGSLHLYSFLLQITLNFTYDNQTTTPTLHSGGKNSHQSSDYVTWEVLNVVSTILIFLALFVNPLKKKFNEFSYNTKTKVTLLYQQGNK